MGLEDSVWQQELADLRGVERLGVYGGTFDPIHTGHLIVAEEARHVLMLDKVLFVPARISPLKQGLQAGAIDHRLEMVRLAIAGNPHFVLSHIDVSRRGPSFTVETLGMLTEALPGTELFFIMGMDSLMTFHHWRNPQGILDMAKIAVVTRPGCEIQIQEAYQVLPPLQERCIFIDTLQIGISSTDIRERLHVGRPICYQVPADVEEYIRDHRLYL